MGGEWILLILIAPVAIFLFIKAVKFEKEKILRDRKRALEIQESLRLIDSIQNMDDDEEEEDWKDLPDNPFEKEYLDLTGGEPIFKKS